MNYYPAKVNFREVIRADTFHIPLNIDPAFPLKPDARIVIQVRPTGDIPEEPILTFDTVSGSISVDGQVMTLHKEPEEMRVRSGRFVYDTQVTQEQITTTLMKGIFEIIQDHTEIS